jgi:Lrp/AsnC ligand binding domain
VLVARARQTFFNVAGDDDYLLHVAVADTDQLRELVLNRLGVRCEVEHVRTSLVYQHTAKPVLAPVDQLKRP